MVNRHNRIMKALESLHPTSVELVDESHKHASHVEHLGEAAGLGETHFHLTLVCEKFEGLPRIDRQRLINALLSSEFKNGLHALQMKLSSTKEHAAL